MLNHRCTWKLHLNLKELHLKFLCEGQFYTSGKIGKFQEWIRPCTTLCLFVLTGSAQFSTAFEEEKWSIIVIITIGSPTHLPPPNLVESKHVLKVRYHEKKHSTYEQIILPPVQSHRNTRIQVHHHHGNVWLHRYSGDWRCLWYLLYLKRGGNIYKMRCG